MNYFTTTRTIARSASTVLAFCLRRSACDAGRIMSALTSARAIRIYRAIWQATLATAAFCYATGQWGRQQLDRSVEDCLTPTEQLEPQHIADVVVNGAIVVAEAVIVTARAIVQHPATVWAVEAIVVAVEDAIADVRYGLRWYRRQMQVFALDNFATAR